MSDDLEHLFANRSDVPLPDEKDVFLPAFYYVAVMPRLPPEKHGSIFIPEMISEKEQWTNYVGQIISLGPLAFRHEKWKRMGLTDDMIPKRGEFWCYRPNGGYRMDYKGIKFIALYDDSFVGKVPEGCNAWDYRAGL